MPPSMILIGCFFMCCLNLEAQTQLAPPYSDGMVMKADSAQTLFGNDTVGTRIEMSCSWNDEVQTTHAGEDGRFAFKFTSPLHRGPHTLSIRGTSRVLVQDILCGDVWLCSGQSNMEMPLGNFGGGYTGVVNFAAEIAAAQDPELRFFQVTNAVAHAPSRTLEGKWVSVSPETARSLSATAYFFARDVRSRSGRPLGVISTDWGGTPIESWMSKESLQTFPELREDLQRLKQRNATPGVSEDEQSRLAEVWIQKLGKSDPIARQIGKTTFENSNTTTTLPRVFDNNLAGFDGTIWLKRVIQLGEKESKAALYFESGAIDDNDVLWINGHLVGHSSRPDSFRMRRRYAIPEGILCQGDNVVDLRVFDSGGEAAIRGDETEFRLAFSDRTTALPLKGEWLISLGRPLAELPARPSVMEVHAHTPTALYNAMIAPLEPFRVSGFLWYQGESNRPRAVRYFDHMVSLISDWRRRFGTSETPFLFVEIAPFSYANDRGETFALREAQTRVLNTPFTGMAPSGDIGDPRDIHPADKQSVGKRLALWAEYFQRESRSAEDLVPRGPIPSGFKAVSGAMQIQFSNTGGKLWSDGELTGFLLAGADGVFHAATATLNGNQATVVSSKVQQPEWVRFGFGAAEPLRLKNSLGLPASPFRSDSLPIPARP